MKHTISIYVDDPEQFHVDLQGDLSSKYSITDEEMNKLVVLLAAQDELQKMLGNIWRREQ